MNAIIPYDVTKYRVRRNHTVRTMQYALLSADQHSLFHGKLRPADEKYRRNVDEYFTNFSFSFRLLVEISSQF